jgi:MinD-like ATPase involved in chromosome partitioning or flagellar assembly
VDAEDLVAKNRHADPLIRRMGRGVIKGLGSGAQGIREMGEVADLLGRQVPSYRQIAVVSVRGGAGKTTMAALLSTELARQRGDRVLAVDADAELGSLPLRLGVRSEYSLFDLAGRQPQTFEEALPYLTQTRDGLWVLPASRNGRIAGEFTLETFQAALGSINRYFSAAIVDCGAGILTELHGGILATTHAQVLVTPGTVDGALSARGALEWFTANGQGALLSRTVIAMVTHAPHGGADIDRAVQMLNEGGMQVVQVPYDRHLATGGMVSLDKMGAGTRNAVTRVAAEVFARALGLSGVAR